MATELHIFRSAEFQKPGQLLLSIVRTVLLVVGPGEIVGPLLPG